MRKDALLVAAVLGVLGSSSAVLADTMMETQTYFMPEQQVSGMAADVMVYSDQVVGHDGAQVMYGTDTAMVPDGIEYVTDGAAYAGSAGSVDYVTEEVLYTDGIPGAVDYGMQEIEYSDAPVAGDGEYISVDITAYEVAGEPTGTVEGYSRTVTTTY